MISDLLDRFSSWFSVLVCMWCIVLVFVMWLVWVGLGIVFDMVSGGIVVFVLIGLLVVLL